MPDAVYTYRGGEKVLLTKQPDEFVVRALPERLRAVGIPDAEKVSSSSSRVTVPPGELDPMMARSRGIAPTHHAYKVADSGQEFLITDRILVSFKEVLSAEQAAEFAGRYGLVQLQAYSDRDYLFQLTNHTGINPLKLVVKLTETEPLVAAAENDLNYRARKQALTLPTDPAYARQWHLHTRFSHPQLDARATSRCEAAWQLLDNLGSPEVVVGITDDGCKLDHGDFDTPGKFANWGYFEATRLVTRDSLGAVPSRMYQAEANHGTSCAGVVAGEADAVLTVGAAPGCRLLPIKWESDGPYLLISDSKMLTALEFIADKVDVLSNSWGHVPLNLTAVQVVNRIRELGSTGGRRGRGIVFLWAAGNENCPIQHDAAVPTPYSDGWEFRQGSWQWAGVATARTFRNNLVGVPGVMHVAALASTAQRSHYSNYGTGIGICAPSSNSHAYWRMNVPGLGITTTTGEPLGVTDEFGGTSSATPLVAGIAALVISANPALTALEVIALLKRTAARDLNLQVYARTPAAAFDPNPTWDVSPIAPFNQGTFQSLGLPEGTWSPWFGHGCVDAAAAVIAARASLPQPGPGAGPEPPAASTGQYASTPALAIPDNKQAGIRDAIRVNETGALNFLRVSVDISHTFIGDLRVTLIAPSGKSLVLHDRTGAGADNLRRVYEPGTTPALRTFEGEAVRGDWTLWVQDLAPADRGKLERWGLELGVTVQESVEVSESPGIGIPDDTPAGVVRSLPVVGTGTVRDVVVDVDIAHTYIGDLTISLRSPQGTQVVLHNRSGGGTDNLRSSYASAEVAALQAMRGQPIAGSWQLIVADMEAADVGKLNRWGLRITRQPEAVPASSSVRSRRGGARRLAPAPVLVRARPNPGRSVAKPRRR